MSLAGQKIDLFGSRTGSDTVRGLRATRIIRVSYTAWVLSGSTWYAAGGELCERRATWVFSWVVQGRFPSAEGTFPQMREITG